MTQLRYLAILLLVLPLVPTLGAGVTETNFGECIGGFSYLLEADNGGHYALVGLPPNLRSQFANHTARIAVNGTYYPSNSGQDVHPDLKFRGVIYVNQYIINEVKSNKTNQIPPMTITLATGLVTLTPISVSGVLDYTKYCITPLLATSSTSSTLWSPTQPVPGFTTVSIVLGLVLGISVLGLLRTIRKILTKMSASLSRILG